MPPPTQQDRLRLAIVYPGDRQVRAAATPENNRFAHLFRAFAEAGIQAEPAVYHDDLCDEVRPQLLAVDGALVWVNPVHEGRDRSRLDALLRQVADAGVLVSAHPDVIDKLGTKEVVYRTRSLGWGCDTALYRSPEQMRAELPSRLAAGRPRVLKLQRGNGGDGVWKVQLEAAPSAEESRRETPGDAALLRVLHAKRGSAKEVLTLGALYRRFAPSFAAGGCVVDQEYQERLAEGMARCYLVRDRVEGFGVQAVNALYPTLPDAPVAEPTQRLYHPPDLPELQGLKRTLEEEWVPAARRLLGIERESLPILWDCDFLRGEVGPHGDDRWVLCEINASSVAPFPDSAVAPVVAATEASLRQARQRRPRPSAR